jgi:hypothetical protein
MNDSSSGVGVGVVCPLCESDGWPSSLRIYAMQSSCGTAWSVDGSFVSQSEPCRIIAAERLRGDLLQLEVDRLMDGVAS